MFNSNTTDSMIKTTLDNWYSSNMTDYTEMLEDTVWCNDRSMRNSNGWTKDGDANNYLYFGGEGRLANSPYKSSLECKRKEDSFTVSSENGNGKLTYPVALLTADEMTLAGQGWSVYIPRGYLNTGQYWWSFSPSSFLKYDASEYLLNSSGYLRAYIANSSNAVRPVVSLVPDIMVTKGDGTVSNPYQIIKID